MKQFSTISKTLLLAGLGLLWSCDFSYHYECRIVNQTGVTIIVETPSNGAHTIAPSANYAFSDHGGTCAQNFFPPDLYEDEQPVIGYPYNELDIYVKTTPDADYAKLSGDLKLRKYWTFESKKYLGVYTLRLTDELVDELIAAED